MQSRISDRFLLTISLSIDFAAAPLIGDWVVERAEVINRTGKLVFVQGLASVAGVVVGQASGVFRIGPPADPAHTVARLAASQVEHG